jgi:DNA-binding transcriptional LysR family regulator
MEHLRGMIAFVAAAREGSFTRAARTLDLSPQAVAGSIARLEESLDVRLFNRTTRSIALTDEGEVFLAQAARGLDALRDAAQSARDKNSAPSGLVRVTCGAAFGRRYLMPLLPAFAKRYPDVRLDLSFDDRKVDLVRDGYDIAIRGGAIADSSLVARRIGALAGVLVASPSYLAKHGVPKTIEDLESHRIVSLRFASGLTALWEFRAKGKAVSFEPKNAAITLSDTEGVGEAAVLGLGIARVSLHFAWAHLQAGRLKLVLAQFSDPGHRELAIHYPHREQTPQRIKAFVDFLIESLKKESSMIASFNEAKRFSA